MTPLEETVVRIVEERNQKIPLLGVTVNVNIVDHIADVELVHEWVNPRDMPVTAEYVTPIAGGNRAVHRFVAQFADQTVVAQMMESKKADDTYKRAIERGDTAFRGEQLSSDALKFSLGNIPAGEHITTRLSYTQRLDVAGGKTRWSLPTCVGPRYCAVADRPELADPSMGSQQVADYRLTVRGSVRSHWPLVIIHSEDPIAVAKGEDYTGQQTVEFSIEGVRLDHPIVVDIETSEVGEPVCWAQYDPEEDQTALLLSMTPVPASTSEQAHEIIFMLDRSGSMMGPRIKTARKALAEAIARVPSQTLLNVVSFGSRWELLYPQSRAVTGRDRENLIRTVERMDATLGGTEIGGAVRSALATHRPEEGVTRQVVLITDGEVGSTDGDQLVALVRGQPDIRFFTIGIGSSVSESTCRQLAKTSGGAFEWVATDEGTLASVQRQLSRILTPVLECTVVDWGDTTAQIPYQLRPMYVDEPMFVYGIRDGRVTEGQVGVAFVDPIGFEVTKLATIESLPDGQSIWRLAISEQLEDLQYGTHGYVLTADPEVKETIVHLSVKYSILSPHTKFVGVRQNTEAQTAEATVSVPQYSPADQTLSMSSYRGAAMAFVNSGIQCGGYYGSDDEEDCGDMGFGLFDDVPVKKSIPMALSVDTPTGYGWLDVLVAKLRAFESIRRLLDQEVNPRWPQALRLLVEYSQTGVITQAGVKELRKAGISENSDPNKVKQIVVQLLGGVTVVGTA